MAIPHLNGFSLLTRREIEVLSLIADGNTTKEIAFKLDVSFKTVGYTSVSPRRKTWEF
jgi:DNA-binding NarL/FixJ family response regulator